jgi:hypothetical protein
VSPRSIYQVRFQVCAQVGDHHAGSHVQTARQCRLDITVFRLVPDLTVAAFAVPAVVTNRDRIHLDVLEAAKEFVFLRHQRPVSTQIDLYQLFKPFKESSSQIRTIQGSPPDGAVKTVGVRRILQQALQTRKRKSSRSLSDFDPILESYYKSVGDAYT